MTTRLNPYLSFSGNAREAMGFYQSVFGGETTFMTFAEMPGDHDPSEVDNIMHSQLLTDGHITLMGADTPIGMGEPGANGSISLSGEDEGELTGYWDKLSGSGKVIVPLEKAPWGDSFGMCFDGYGIQWLVNISAAQA
ncbi:MAG: VOC family protein [Aeromicrobium sp.]